MESLYPSLLAAIATVILGDRVPHLAPRRFGALTSLSALLYTVSLFVHFLVPDNRGYLWVTVSWCVWIVIWASGRGMFVLPESLAIASVLSWLQFRWSTWYPFVTWHGIPVEYVACGVWFLLVQGLCRSFVTKAVVSAQSVLIVIFCSGAFAVGASHDPVVFGSLKGSMETFTLNVFWVTLSLWMGSEAVISWLTKIQLFGFNRSFDGNHV